MTTLLQLPKKIPRKGAKTQRDRAPQPLRLCVFAVDLNDHPRDARLKESGGGSTLLLPIGMIDELNDPAVGPAILAEAGPGYPIHVRAAAGLIVIASAAGSIHRRSQRLQADAPNN